MFTNTPKSEKFKREFNKRFSACFCKFSTASDQQDRTNVSMHTRASSVRSTYANSSMRARYGGRGKFPPATQAHFRKEKETTTMIMLKNPVDDQSLYNMKALSKTNAEKGFTSDGAAELMNLNASANGNGQNNVNGKFKYYWRNHFKLLHSTVIENEDNQSLLELQIPISSISEHDSSAADEIVCKSETAHETESCICEVEFGSRTECDGTCILNEVSRVQVPAILILSPSKGSSVRCTRDDDINCHNKIAKDDTITNAVSAKEIFIKECQFSQDADKCDKNKQQKRRSL